MLYIVKNRSYNQRAEDQDGDILRHRLAQCVKTWQLKP